MSVPFALCANSANGRDNINKKESKKRFISHYFEIEQYAFRAPQMRPIFYKFTLNKFKFQEPNDATMRKWEQIRIKRNKKANER